MQTRNIRSVEQRTRTVCLLILTAIAIGAALLFLKPVLQPFVLALFLTMAVTPVLDFLRVKFHMPRGIAIGFTIGVASFVLVVLGGLVSVGLADVADKRQVYIDQVGGMIDAGEEVIGHWVGVFEHLLGVGGDVESSPDIQPGNSPDLPATTELPTAQGVAQGEASPGATESTPGAPAPSTRWLADLRGEISQMVEHVISWTLESGFNLLSQGLLVMVFMMFLITGYRSAGEGDALNLRQEIRLRVKEYLRVKILASMITGTFTFVILHVLEVDLALVFGLMAFFLNFIPNIGSVIAVLLPLPVIWLAPPEVLSLTEKLLASLLPAVVQFLVGNILEPRWMGKSLDLNPVVILLSLIFWGVLWGPVGMLLSVPITAVLRMLLERSELTRPVALLLSEDG